MNRFIHPKDRDTDPWPVFAVCAVAVVAVFAVFVLFMVLFGITDGWSPNNP